MARRVKPKLEMNALLRAVACHCTAPDIAELLGYDAATVRKWLRRAELAELVTESGEGSEIRVWELTPRGVERINASERLTD